jgi:hypothetical protein
MPNNEKMPENMATAAPVTYASSVSPPVTVVVKKRLPYLLIIFGIVLLALVTVLSFTSWAQVIGNIISALSFILGFALGRRGRA